MFLLHADEKFYTSRCEKISDDGGCTVFRSPVPREPSKLVASLRGNETILSDGFNTHSVKLPNGRVIEISEDGQIVTTESDGQRRKLRHKDKIEQNIIK